MTWSPILAFAIIALAFGIGDVIAAKTRGVISSVLVAILLFLIFGSTLKVLPADLMEQSGLMSLIPTFGMALILVNVGSMLDLNDLKREWKTVIISLAGVAGLVTIYLTAGTLIFGKEYALSAMGPASGGMAATMILTAAANEAGRADLAGFVASVMALQVLIGLPIASFCLRKEANRFLVNDAKQVGKMLSDEKKLSIRILPPTPKTLDTPNIHLARAAFVGFIAYTVTTLTGISSGITYLVGGILFAALGIIEPGAVRKAGGEGLLMLPTYCSVTSSFVSMTLKQFGGMLPVVIGLLVLGAVGVVIFSIIIGKLLKWSPWLSIAVGIGCMLGYPVNYAAATEVSSGVASANGIDEEEEKKLLNHLLPKMIVSCVVSVSIASVVLAGLVTPILLG